MGLSVKKAPAKSGQEKKSGTKKPAAGLRASGHGSSASKAAAHKPQAGHKPAAAKPAHSAKPIHSSKPTSVKKPKVTPLKSTPTKAVPKPAAAKAAPPKPALPKAAAPKSAPSKVSPAKPEAPIVEAAPPPSPRPSPPRPVVAPPPMIQAPPAPKPNLVKLSSLEPAEAARLGAVRNLLEAQGRHDLPGILACFGSQPTLEFAGGPRHIGSERVGQIYGDLLRAFPDLMIEVQAEHLADRSIVVEMLLQGTHRQQWLGMAPRGRALSLPVCNVFVFDKRDQISALRIYLDRNLAIVQLTSGLLR